MHVNNSKIAENKVVWHQSQVTRADRARLFRQTPATIWFTGLSGAGKSTLAFTLEKRLIELGQACYVLDGDNIRHGLNQDLGFSPGHRTENIRRIAEVAKLMNDAGLIVLTSFISPYREDRELARSVIGIDNFLEVYVNTPLPVCEERDPKGFYKLARSGGMPDFTGISAPYEPPLNPVLSLSTDAANNDLCIKSILAILENRIKS